jgi:hypothetical protein
MRTVCWTLPTQKCFHGGVNIEIPSKCLVVSSLHVNGPKITPRRRNETRSLFSSSHIPRRTRKKKYVRSSEMKYLIWFENKCKVGIKPSNIGVAVRTKAQVVHFSCGFVPAVRWLGRCYHRSPICHIGASSWQHGPTIRRCGSAIFTYPMAPLRIWEYSKK